MQEISEELLSKLQRVEDIQEINNLQHRYLYGFGMLDVDAIMECFSHDPNVTMELGNKGKYAGWETIKQTFQDKLNDSKSRPGVMGNLMAMSPVIEIDEGGKTASGLWYAFGPISVPYKNNELTAMWLFGKYEVKYVKEDGKWKFHNLHFVLIFRTTVNDGWVKVPECIHQLGLSHALKEENTSPHKPYNPDIFNEFLPGPPKPVKHRK